MAALFSPQPKAAGTTTAATRSAIRSWSIRGAASWPKAGPSRAWSWPRSIRPKSRRRAAKCPRCLRADASNWSSRWPNRPTCTPCGSRYDPLRTQLRPGPYFRELVPEFGGLRQASQARAGSMPGLRLGESREGDDGAALVVKRGRRDRSAEAPHSKPNAEPSARAAACPDAAGCYRISGGDVAARARTAAEAQGNPRAHHQECKLCRHALSRRSPQDSLRRDRTLLDLRRSLAGRGQGIVRRRHRISSAADTAGRPELSRHRSGFSATTM